jgi:putative transposase
MRAEGLRGIPRDKSCRTTIGNGAETERPEDLVKRTFTATAPNQLWVADLAYVRTHAGWTFVAFVLTCSAGWLWAGKCPHRYAPTSR